MNTTGTYHLLCILYLLFCEYCLVSGRQLFRETTTFQSADEPTRAKPINERINLTFPGTKWCGPGNTASGYDDLGELIETDSCCRAHDHCDSMASGETKNNLTNNDYFTKLHCDCDKEFYHCLHTVNSNVSNRIGKLYFGLRSECYRNDYPIVKCVEYDTAVFIRRCYRYVLDESQSKLYQWFDLPLYNGKYGDDYWRSIGVINGGNLID